jgi:hypothetical protein
VGTGFRTLVVTAAVAGLLLAGYEISPLSDPQVPTAEMRDAAERVNNLLAQKLYPLNNTGDDQRFEVSDQAFANMALLDVRQRHTTTDRTVEVDYVISGAVGSRVIGWGPGKGVQACYRYTFTNMLYTLRHRVIDCPGDLPPPPQPGARTARAEASPAAGSTAANVWAAHGWTAELAQRIRPPRRPAGTTLHPAPDELDRLLTTAHIDPALPRALSMRSGVALLALGTAHQCVLAAMDTRTVNVWPAPFEAPCTTDRAYQSYAMAFWPPLPGT